MSLPVWPVIKRGLRMKCPHCGEGRLLSGYLKPVDHCFVCLTDYRGIRADDGPAWLTILIVGHVLAPFMPVFVEHADWPVWFSVTFWCGVALVMTLFLLPRSKGLFISLIWRARQNRD